MGEAPLGIKKFITEHGENKKNVLHSYKVPLILPAKPLVRTN